MNGIGPSVHKDGKEETAPRSLERRGVFTMFWKKKPKKKKKPAPKNTVVKKHPQDVKKTQSSKTPSSFSKEKAQHSNPPSPLPKEKERNTVKREKNTPPCIDKDYKKEFLKVFNKLTYTRRAYEVWSDFILMFACSISNALDKANFDKREGRYLKTVKKYKKQDQILFPELAATTVMALEENPEQDFLGGIFMSLNLGDIKMGQFFTPYHVCELMAEVSMEDAKELVDEKGYIAINDPCCGSGALLIAGIHASRRKLEKENINFQNHVFVAGQDICETVALMCYIQISLLGAAGFVKVGNSFTEPISDKDSSENYWFTPMYFSDVWATRRVLRDLNNILKGDKNGGA